MASIGLWFPRCFVLNGNYSSLSVCTLPPLPPGIIIKHMYLISNKRTDYLEFPGVGWVGMSWGGMKTFRVDTVFSLSFSTTGEIGFQTSKSSYRHVYYVCFKAISGGNKWYYRWYILPVTA